MEHDNAILRDEDTLNLLGKREILKRRFNFWSLFAFAVCELITWETVLALISQPLMNGGPAGAIYGFTIAWLSTLYVSKHFPCPAGQIRDDLQHPKLTFSLRSVYAVISELASMMPISCGQYYFVYRLAPSRYKKFWSYIIGWLTALAWIATVAIETLFAGTMVQGLIKLSYPNYASKPYQGALLTMAVMAVNIFINVVTPNLLPKLELTMLAIHVVGFVAIMAALLSTADKGTSSSVWLTAANLGGWPTQGLSFCVGFLGNIATFVGGDASTHMSEEVAHSQLNIPRAICAGMIFDGIVGFAMMVAVLYCLGDADSVLQTPTGFPFMQIFYNSVKSVGGAIGMCVVVLVLTWGCATGIMTTASRMTWSFARDKGTPFSQFLSTVNHTTRIPVNAVFLVSIFAALLVLIYIGSSVAFNDVISLTITGFYGSYFLPCALLLYHRVRGNILPYGSPLQQGSQQLAPVPSQLAPAPSANGLLLGEGAKTQQLPLEIENASSESESSESPLVWGPWHLAGAFGTINNAYACVYVIYVIFWSVWPPATPVSVGTMNYSIVVTGGVLILSAVWYVVRGRHVYKGPVVEV